MGVYLNTFRTESKTALYKGEPVKVFAFRYLCRANDADVFARDCKYAKLMQAQCERASERFAKLAPVYVAGVHDDNWDGVTVYANPKGACHYDTEALTPEPIGFLKQLAGSQAYANGAKGWVITGEYHREDSRMACGLTVRRAYVERVAVGVPYSQTVKSYTFSNGTVFTPEQFEAWRAKEEPLYVAACQKRREEQEKAEQERQAAWQLQQKRDKVNKEIEAARANLARLEQERAQIS